MGLDIRSHHRMAVSTAEISVVMEMVSIADSVLPTS